MRLIALLLTFALAPLPVAAQSTAPMPLHDLSPLGMYEQA